MKNPFLGQKLRDPVRNPISMEDLGGIQFLKKFSEWLKTWENMSDTSNKLSRETFLTSIQTTLGLIGVAIYLLENRNFDYVLLGMITSDPIERRFGWYRQLGGANYYLSVRQFLEAEKKIRLQTLIKFGNISFIEACEVLSASQKACDFKNEAQTVINMVGSDFETDFEANDEEGILYFTAGFVARGEAKKLKKCDSCLNLFVKSKEPPKIDFDSDLGDKKRDFMDQINRGGLCTPTDSVYISVLHARQLYNEIHEKRNVRDYFLSLKNQREVFCEAFQLKMMNDSNTCVLLEQECKNNHKFSERISSIASRIFNIFSKNFIAEINDRIHEERKRSNADDSKKCSKSRKIKKLQSN